MTYLVVGLDQSTFAPWHQNVRAVDVTAAREIACVRARAGGITLAVAAVIGPNMTVMPEPARRPERPPRAPRRSPSPGP